MRIAGLEPAHLSALPPQSSVSANSTICAPVNNQVFTRADTRKNESVLTAVLTQKPKHTSNKRFQRVGYGLVRFKKTGMLYGVFKSAGRTRWKSLGTDDLIFARQLLSEEIKRAVKVDWKQAGVVTVSQLIERYENNPMNLAPSTLKIRKHLLGIFQRTWPFGLGIKARDVKPFMLRSWLSGRRTEQKLKATGVNNYIRLLHGLFALAVDLGAVAENPAEQVELLSEESPERITPTWQQAQCIIKSVKRPPSKIALKAMLLLGLGQAELRNIRGEHFDLTRGVIVVRRQKTQKIFTVPIFPQARQFVECLQNEGHLEPQKQVFKISNPREAISLACRRLNYPAFTPRSFRRAFIIRALEKGVDPRVVAVWQGHRDATLILRVYGAWINQAHAQRMAALMN